MGATGGRWVVGVVVALGLTVGGVMGEEEALRPPAVGLGVGLTQDPATLAIEISMVIPGGAAEGVGLLAGDQLLQVGSHIVIGMPLNEVIELLRGDYGEPVVLIIQRPGEDRLLEVLLVRGVFLNLGP